MKFCYCRHCDARFELLDDMQFNGYCPKPICQKQLERCGVCARQVDDCALDTRECREWYRNYQKRRNYNDHT